MKTKMGYLEEVRGSERDTWREMERVLNDGGSLLLHIFMQ